MSTPRGWLPLPREGCPTRGKQHPDKETAMDPPPPAGPECTPRAPGGRGPSSTACKAHPRPRSQEETGGAGGPAGEGLWGAVGPAGACAPQACRHGARPGTRGGHGRHTRCAPGQGRGQHGEAGSRPGLAKQSPRAARAGPKARGATAPKTLIVGSFRRASMKSEGSKGCATRTPPAP